MARWLEVLSEFDYTVVHRAGKQHTNADALSPWQVQAMWKGRGGGGG